MVRLVQWRYTELSQPGWPGIAARQYNRDLSPPTDAAVLAEQLAKIPRSEHRNREVQLFVGAPWDPDNGGMAFTRMDMASRLLRAHWGDTHAKGWPGPPPGTVPKEPDEVFERVEVIPDKVFKPKWEKRMAEKSHDELLAGLRRREAAAAPARAKKVRPKMSLRPAQPAQPSQPSSPTCRAAAHPAPSAATRPVPSTAAARPVPSTAAARPVPSTDTSQPWSSHLDFPGAHSQLTPPRKPRAQLPLTPDKVPLKGCMVCGRFVKPLPVLLGRSRSGAQTLLAEITAFR